MLRIPLVLMAAMVWFPIASAAQNEELTDSNVPEFLARYEQSLGAVNQAFDDLVNENLPLHDETGQPLGRHHIEDQRQTLVSLRDTLHRLASNPQDVVQFTTLLVQNEVLADDLYDLSQTAYDNDREELGKHFADLEASVDHDNQRVEAYALKLAGAKQDRIVQLEKENRELQEKLKEAQEKEKTRKPVASDK
jgi:hypothetical protein